MNLPSYWETDTFIAPSDYLIIGSGIVGLTAAIHLKEKQPHSRVTIVERGVLPSGASTKNAGFACFGSISELLDDLEEHTEEEVFSLVELRWRGLQRLRSLVPDADLDYQEYGAYEVFKSDENFDYCADKINYFNTLLKNITQTDKTFSVADQNVYKFGFQGIKHLILNKAEGQIHTGKMMGALLAIAQSKNINILNGATVKAIEDQGDRTIAKLDNGWELQAQKIMVATNGFAKQLYPNLALQAARNQVLVTKPIPKLPFKGCFHFEKGYVYFRNINNRVILGGGRHQALEAESIDQFGLTANIQNYLLNLLKTNFIPACAFEIDRWWSGIMGVGHQKRPIVEKLSSNVIVAVRLGGMGVAIGSLIGSQGADLCLD